MQLAQRRGVPPDRQAELAIGNLALMHDDVVERDAAAGGQALPHAVPVVMDGDAGPAGRHQHADRPVLLVQGAEDRIVGKGGAGRVELAPDQPEPVAVAQKTRRHLPRLGGAELGRGSREQGAVENKAQQFPRTRRVLAQHMRFGEVEMRAQRMRHIRIGSGERDDDLDQVAQAPTGTAETGRHAQGAEAGFAEQTEALMRQFAPLLALGGADGKTSCQLRQARQQLLPPRSRQLLVALQGSASRSRHIGSSIWQMDDHSRLHPRAHGAYGHVNSLLI